MRTPLLLLLLGCGRSTTTAEPAPNNVNKPSESPNEQPAETVRAPDPAMFAREFPGAAASLQSGETVAAYCSQAFGGDSPGVAVAVVRDGQSGFALRGAGVAGPLLPIIEVPTFDYSHSALVCFSAAKVEESNRNFTPEHGVEGNIASGGRPVVCVATDHTDFACFAYKPDSKVWEAVGGWYT